MKSKSYGNPIQRIEPHFRKRNKPMKRTLPIILIFSGIIIFFVGFVYDVLFAGIPYQDPTPAMLASYSFHARTASIIRWSGAGMFTLSAVASCICWLMEKKAQSGNLYKQP